ncbi:hypothetical protein IFR05_005907 [Cadophora sp. M221]|nr:hypothetical protein IFR05_005907 [Cadophora sp. M221]
MQVILTAILSMMLLFISSHLARAAISVPDPFEGYTMGEMRFVGSFGGLEGVTVNTTGTINEIIAQVQADHPNWKPNLSHPDRHGPPINDASVSARDNAVESADLHKSGMFCWPLAGRLDLQRADSTDFDKIIRYLAYVNGVPYAGSRQCV